jgi:hypothetical protein
MGPASAGAVAEEWFSQRKVTKVTPHRARAGAGARAEDAGGTVPPRPESGISFKVQRA